MFASIENKYGVINFGSQLINQIINDAVENCDGKLWLKSKSYEITERGLLIELDLYIRFGCSMSSLAYRVIDAVNRDVTESLELPVDNIKLRYIGTVSKNIAPRDILFDYREWFCHHQ